MPPAGNVRRSNVGEEDNTGKGGVGLCTFFPLLDKRFLLFLEAFRGRPARRVNLSDDPCVTF